MFGVTVAGRPPEIPGIESMIGLFINTLPLRLRLRADERLIELLIRLQENQDPADCAPARGIERDPATGGSRRVVRYHDGVRRTTGGCRRCARETRGGGAHHRWRRARRHPLCPDLAAVPGARLHLRLDYRGSAFDRGTIEGMAQRLVRLLTAVAADPEATDRGSGLVGRGGKTPDPV